jgi:hypothetical protein
MADDQRSGGEIFPEGPSAGGALPPAAAGRTGPPWERGGDFFSRFFDTMKGVLLDPVALFKNMRREGGLSAPLIYGIIGTVIGSVVGILFQAMLRPDRLSREIPLLGPFLEGAALAFTLVWVPIVAILVLFIASGIYHVLLMLFNGARFPFETTFRVTAYTAGSTGPIGIIPFCGGLISLVWGIIALIIGLREAHETSTGKAAAAVLVPVAVCCAAAAVVGVIAAALVAFGRGFS